MARPEATPLQSYEEKLVFRHERFCFIQRDSLLLLVGQVRHVDGDGGAVSEFDWGVRRAAGADAIDPVLHVVLIWGLALHGLARRTIRFFGPVLDGLFE